LAKAYSHVRIAIPIEVADCDGDFAFHFREPKSQAILREGAVSIA
jgi:hypothetical protein